MVPNRISRTSRGLLGTVLLVACCMSGGARTASAAVLYDQTSGSLGTFVPSMQTGSSTYEPQTPSGLCGTGRYDSSCFAADDFTIPPGPAWYIKNVHVDGQGGAGDGMRWEALRSDTPPADPFQAEPFDLPTGGTWAGAGNSLPPSSASGDFDLTAGSGDVLGQPLPPGHYWLSAFAVFPLASAWSWREQAATAEEGSPAMWAAPSCSPASYTTLTACGQGGPGLSFRIEGEVIDRSFSWVKIGKELRKPSGAVDIEVTIAGLAQQELAVKEVGAGPQVRTSLEAFRRIEDGKVVRLERHYAGGPVPGILEVEPGDRAHEELRSGQTVKLRLSISYKREINSHLQVPIAVPTGSKTVDVVLKKPPGSVGR